MAWHISLEIKHEMPKLLTPTCSEIKIIFLILFSSIFFLLSSYNIKVVNLGEKKKTFRTSLKATGNTKKRLKYGTCFRPTHRDSPLLNGLSKNISFVLLSHLCPSPCSGMTVWNLRIHSHETLQKGSRPWWTSFKIQSCLFKGWEPCAFQPQQATQTGQVEMLHSPVLGCYWRDGIPLSLKFLWCLWRLTFLEFLGS